MASLGFDLRLSRPTNSLKWGKRRGQTARALGGAGRLHTNGLLCSQLSETIAACDCVSAGHGPARRIRAIARHSKRRLRQIADSIRAFGFLNPIVLDDDGMVLAGHGRLEAAKLVGLETVPTVRASGLTEAQKRAYVLADNKLAEKAGWDRELLVAELGDLAVLLPQIDLDLTLTGFDPPEIDTLFADRGPPRPDPADDVPATGTPACTRPGDLWCLGPHRLLCGDARSGADIERLMAGQQARVTFTDPPCATFPVAGRVHGRGRVRHREFAFASGEMSRVEFRAFLQECLGHVARVSRDGAIAFVCMDWRRIDGAAGGRRGGVRRAEERRGGIKRRLGRARSTAASTN